MRLNRHPHPVAGLAVDALRAAHPRARDRHRVSRSCRSVNVGLGLPVFTTLLIGHTLLVLPYVIRVISAALASFDFSIEEAAISLGSHPVKTFFTIVLPMSARA